MLNVIEITLYSPDHLLRSGPSVCISLLATAAALGDILDEDDFVLKWENRSLWRVTMNFGYFFNFRRIRKWYFWQVPISFPRIVSAISVKYLLLGMNFSKYFWFSLKWSANPQIGKIPNKKIKIMINMINDLSFDLHNYWNEFYFVFVSTW